VTVVVGDSWMDDSVKVKSMVILHVDRNLLYEVAYRAEDSLLQDRLDAQYLAPNDAFRVIADMDALLQVVAAIYKAIEWYDNE
jgi:hypothetical protein